MKTPMSTDEVVKKYGEEYAEDSTCSFRCRFCKERIWFEGNVQDATTPKTCVCIKCGKETDTFHW